MFYEFDQNNSGGAFTTDEERGISLTVIIEASSADEANEIAGRIGLYFDEDYVYDCSCCGPRWGAQYGEGTAVPMVGSKPVAEAKPVIRWLGPDEAWGYVHYLCGTVQALRY